jgi:2-oxoisovalerate dehydrogenase E1 component alpha subunit
MSQKSAKSQKLTRQGLKPRAASSSLVGSPTKKRSAPAPTKKKMAGMAQVKKTDDTQANKKVLMQKPSLKKNAVQKVPAKKGTSQLLFKLLEKDLLVRIHDLMLRSRVLEERLIKIYRTGDAYFWIGGPGEEAFGVPLGLLVNKGQGPEYDYLHFHYRCTPSLVAMDMPAIDAIRLIMNKATDPSTGGRNFSNHYCFPQKNVLPVTSVIEVQYLFALGTARVQQRRKTQGITIVTGGDAGSAEGDFASCLIWASRPGNELPMLITVQNNSWGISTSYSEQHGEPNVAERGRAFGIRTRVFNGNDPVESYLVLQEEMNFIRKTGKPSLVEARVSRLHGHSSASGANRVDHEVDCLAEFEQKLLSQGILSERNIKENRLSYEQEALAMSEKVRGEVAPEGSTIWNHIYASNENANWRKF